MALCSRPLCAQLRSVQFGSVFEAVFAMQPQYMHTRVLILLFVIFLSAGPRRTLDVLLHEPVLHNTQHRGAVARARQPHTRPPYRPGLLHRPRRSTRRLRCHRGTFRHPALAAARGCGRRCGPAGGNGCTMDGIRQPVSFVICLAGVSVMSPCVSVGIVY